MPPDYHSSHEAFDIHIPDAQALDALDGLQTALHAFEAACHRGDPEIARMVTALNSRPYILEYIISALEEGAYTRFSKWIVARFPTSRTPNIMDVISMRLLQRFSSSLLSAEYPSTADAPLNPRVLQRKMELSFSVLKNLEENADSALTGGNISSVSRKKGKALTKNRRIDPLLFDSLGITVPTTDVEVRDAYTRVLSQLQSILENHLLVLREPVSSRIFKSSYTEARPSSEAFHEVQPMKTALCFDNVEGFGEWQILLSTRAQKDLRDFRRADGTMFDRVMIKIKQLSQGHFSRGNQKLLTNSKMKLPIYEAKATRDLRIIYHVDCIPDLRNRGTADFQHECQVIRMFGIFTHTQLRRGRFWDTLSRQLQQRGPEYIERCIPQNEPLSVGDNVVLPALFPPLLREIQYTSQAAPLDVSEEDMKDIHSILVLDKFVTLSQPLLNSILADKDVTHVFSVSAQEQEIIEHSSSCYVIGRSGTGKTTTMLFKMLAIHRTWQQYPDMGPKPRQVFITQSPVLADKVAKYFAKLILTYESTTYSQEELRKIEEDLEQEKELVNQKDRTDWRPDLPESFWGLLDEHFPLFITYDRLCTMLEDVVERGDSSDPKMSGLGDEATSPTSTRSRMHAGSHITSSSDYMQQFRKRFVSYGVFLASYWDHLPQTLTRALDPALVFGEFMGVIKGSENTIGTKHRCLDRESYKSLSFRGQGTFSHTRDDIYDLFVAYTKLKRQRQEYDAADRTHYILQKFRGPRPGGRKINFLYVDEVQDNLLIDTLVLRSICDNQHGLFWAGDTAQTISIGSSFRFADLKAYQHRIEKQFSRESGLTPVEPRTFELLSNYRSHGGIVNCARSIVELMMNYWPYSIDALQPERATIDGHRPIFFAVQGDDELEKSCSGSSQSEGAPDLGAEQCIIVRSDAVKVRLEERLKGSMVMTLYESKGQEFNDVFLYNFFEDSTVTPNQWRLVLNEAFDGRDLSNAPTFDEARHASICAELKFLYVAVTRARKNLWIMDSSESAEPMKVYWRSKNQIDIWPSTAEIPCLGVSSTAEEWVKTGRKMFDGERYSQASVAFSRAGRNREAAICDAYSLREKAQSISIIAGAARDKALVTAANAFITCAQDSPSKHVNERQTCYTIAGECYSEVLDLKKAGDSYRMAEQYANAACAYREGGHFDEMVEVINQHKDALDSGLHKRLLMVARMHYFKHLDIQAALKLFDSDLKDALKFLEEYDLDEARVKLLIGLGRILEAAQIHAKNGDMLKAVGVLSTSVPHSVRYIRPMIEYLLTGLWRGFTLGAHPSSTSVPSKLLLLAEQVDKSAMTEKEINELAMFQAIRRTDRPSLRVLAKTFIRSGSDPAALLCLDHVFSPRLKLQTLLLAEVRASLFLYLDYIRLLIKFRYDESLAEGSNHQKLFGFQALGENHYLVPRHGILHEKLVSLPGSSSKMDVYECGSEELRRGITQLIRSRIHDRTKTQNAACREVHGFAPCLKLVVENKCNSPDGRDPCAFLHIQPQQLTVDWYHSRIRLILLQFQILDSARYYDLDVVNYWLGILYSALHPPFQGLGSSANLDVSRIPRAANDLRVVRKWVEYACNNLNSKPPEPADRLRNWYMTACILAFDLDRKNAEQFVPCTPMFESKSWPRSPFREQEDSIVHDFVEFLTAKEPGSLISGSLYLREVLRQQLRVDLNLLCDFVERLSGLFIMARGVNSAGDVLHNVTLPRSWFIGLILPGTDSGGLRKNTSKFFDFVSSMIELVRRVNAQVQRRPTPASDTEEQFTVGGGRMTDFMRSLYISRICLCLCLIGYNTDNEDLKKRILTGIQSLRKGEGQSTPSIYQHYAHAEDWGDLAHALNESLRNSPLDDSILLLHTSIPQERPSEYPRRVFYDELGMVPKLLLSKAPSYPKTITTPVHRQRPRVVTELKPEGNSDEQGQQESTDSPEVIADGKEAEGVLSVGDREEINETRVNAARVIQDAYRRYLEGKRAAAVRMIQTAYRRYLKRGSIVRKGIDATQAHYWHLLRRRSMDMKWSKDSQYYLLFRVPLGYILVCLDVIKAFIESEKKNAKKLIMTKHHKELEELTEALDENSKLLKKTIALQKKLSPSSEFHEGRSVSDLQHAVLEAKAVVERLDKIPGSIGTRNQIRKRWDRGSKWIFEKQGSRAKGKKAEKPKLVLDREDLLYL